MKTLRQDVNDPRRAPSRDPHRLVIAPLRVTLSPKGERAMLSHGLLWEGGLMGARVGGLPGRAQKPSRVTIASSLREGSACAPGLPDGALQHCGWASPGARLGDVPAVTVC